MSLPDPTQTVNCGTQISLSNGFVDIYGNTYKVNLDTTFLTNVAITADFGLQPDRMLIYFDGNVIIDSGYLGDSAKYSYGGPFRSQFNFYLSGKTDPTTGLIYPNTGVTNSAPDGYPYVGGTPSGSQLIYNTSFIKNTTTDFVIVRAFMPYAGSILNITVSCPV